MERFNLKKLNEAEEKEKYRLEVPKRFCGCGFTHWRASGPGIPH
jgi:hypothetical protein